MGWGGAIFGFLARIRTTRMRPQQIAVIDQAAATGFGKRVLHAHRRKIGQATGTFIRVSLCGSHP